MATKVFSVTKAKGGFVVNWDGETHVATTTEEVKKIMDEAFADEPLEEKKEK